MCFQLAAASAYELLAFTRSVQCLNSPTYRSSLAWSQRLVTSRLGYGRVVDLLDEDAEVEYSCDESMAEVMWAICPRSVRWLAELRLLRINA